MNRSHAIAIACALAALAEVGCSVRTAPYRFRSPLVGTVRTDQVSFRRSRGPGNHDNRDAIKPTPRQDMAANSSALTPRPSRSSVPARHLGADANGDELANRLRMLVGARDSESTDLQYAMAALTHLGASLDRELVGADDGPGLLAVAKFRNAALAPPTAEDWHAVRLGDLLVFDNVRGSESASLIAVVVSIDDRGVIEMIYLGRGVVRRGWVAAHVPDQKRDEAGRILNTHIRHNNGGSPRGTRYLSGQLLSVWLPMNRMLR